MFEISLTRGYDEVAFREDLKKLYGMLGAEDKKMVFLFTDSHVADEGFLELINNMLTSGDHYALDGSIGKLPATLLATCWPLAWCTQ